MGFDIYRFIWIFIHFIFDVYDYCTWLMFVIKTKCVEMLEPNRIESLSDDKYMIESTKKYLTKTPVHLAVILGTELPDFHALSKIIMWCLSAGIQHVSFYDHKGILAQFCFYFLGMPKILIQLQFLLLGILVANNSKIYDYLTNWKKETDKICWNINTNGTHGQIVYKNGLKKELSVNFLSPTDCQLKISEVCRELAANKQIHVDQINIEYLDDKFSEFLHPDPDLAIYFGDVCCTYGLLPWHIRLTEFISISTQKTMTIKTFLHTLFTFSKCEQRFGF